MTMKAILSAPVKMPRPSDRWIPWYFVLFFLAIAILDGIFVYIAVAGHTGVITDNAYQKGLAYNQAIADAEIQKILGWRGAISYVQGILSFTLNDKEGRPIDDAAVKAWALRPASDGHDIDLALIHTGIGLYQAPVTFPLPGLWEVRVLAEQGGQHYQQSQRFTVAQ